MEQLAARVAVVHLAFASLASALGTVWVVDSQLAPGAHFATIQQAVDAACCGDIVLVRPRPTPYATFYVDGKSLDIVADGPPNALVSGGARVANLGASQVVVLVGLTIEGFGLAAPAPQFAGNGLRLYTNAGSVRVEDCVLRGADGSPSTDVDGWVGVYVNDSSHVVLDRCTIEGGDGYDVPFAPSCTATGGNGGDALQVWATSAAVFACDVRGGQGGDGCPQGAGGGAAMTLLGFGGLERTVLAAGGSFAGGDGGHAWSVPGFGGSGGEGITASIGYALEFLDADLAGGGSGDTPPVPGAPLVPGGASILQHAGAARRLDAPVPVRESTTFALDVAGAPGDFAFALVSGGDYFGPVSAWKGVLLAGAPTVVTLGVLGPAGTKSVPVPLGPLGAGSQVSTVVLQLAVLDTSLGIVLGSALHQVILDGAF